MSVAKSIEKPKAKWRADWESSCWLLWKIAPDEFERQVANYSTLTITDSVRGKLLVLSVLIGIGLAPMAGRAFWHANDVEGYWSLASGLLLLGLGAMVYRGKAWASLALMAVYTVDRLIGNIMAIHSGESPLGISYREHLGFWLIEGLLAWVIWMHAFYIAYLVERVRGMRKNSPNSAVNELTPADR